MTRSAPQRRLRDVISALEADVALTVQADVDFGPSLPQVRIFAALPGTILSPDLVVLTPDPTGTGEFMATLWDSPEAFEDPDPDVVVREVVVSGLPAHAVASLIHAMLYLEEVR